MQSLDTRGMDELDQTLAELAEHCPELRRGLHEDIAAILKEEVDDAIAATLNGDVGKVQGWQKERVGSGGGYAAISAIGSGDGASTGRDSPGAITNYLNEGHKIRTPADPGTPGRAKVPYVDGRHFYQAAGVRAEARILRAAEEYADRFADKLEGDA